MLTSEDGEATLVYADQIAFIECRQDGTGRVSTTGGDINLDANQREQLINTVKQLASKDPDYTFEIREC
jgi:hypothetical protein